MSRLVKFRDDFSPKLVGLVFEQTDRPSVIDFETKRAFVELRIRVGKRQRWAYRLAYLDDLIEVTGAQ